MNAFQQGQFAPLKSKEILGLTGRTRITVRCEKPALAYHSEAEDFSEEVMVGGGAIQFETTCYGGFVRVQSSGRVWVDFNIAPQRLAASDDVIFTTLDRPAPLSPEMAAIQRFMRQNELERERDRNIMMKGLRDAETRRNDTPGTPQPGGGQAQAETEDEVVEDTSGGPPDTGEQADASDIVVPDPSKIRDEG